MAAWGIRGWGFMTRRLYQGGTIRKAKGAKPCPRCGLVICRGPAFTAAQGGCQMDTYWLDP